MPFWLYSVARQADYQLRAAYKRCHNQPVGRRQPDAAPRVLKCQNFVAKMLTESGQLPATRLYFRETGPAPCETP